MKEKGIKEKIEEEGNFKIIFHYGFPCLVLRPYFLRLISKSLRDRPFYLCGYVGVPKGHPLYKKNYKDNKFPDLNVHGGVTFTGFLSPVSGKEFWFIGFDCAHAFDIISKFDIQLKSNIYRDMDYVSKEIKKLAKQINRIK